MQGWLHRFWCAIGSLIHKREASSTNHLTQKCLRPPTVDLRWSPLIIISWQPAAVSESVVVVDKRPYWTPPRRAVAQIKRARLPTYKRLLACPSTLFCAQHFLTSLKKVLSPVWLRIQLFIHFEMPVNVIALRYLRPWTAPLYALASKYGGAVTCGNSVLKSCRLHYYYLLVCTGCPNKVFKVIQKRKCKNNAWQEQ